MTRASEDQDTIQRPDITKDPEIESDIKKHTAHPIEENIDSPVMSKSYTWAFDRVALKQGRIRALISRAI